MTGFTFFFLFFEITELYDDTELMIFKPDEYAREQARKASQVPASIIEQNNHVRDRKSYKQSCIYELILCGGVRRCLFLKLSEKERVKKRARCIGLSICTALMLCSAAVMELCNRYIWTEWFPQYQPHYSEVQNFDHDHINMVDRLIWAKTAVCGYVIVFAVLLRISFFICLVPVASFGFPFFIYFYFRYKKEEQANQMSKKEK